MYFACLTPAITFGGLLKKDTHYIGIIECLSGVSVCGVFYHFFAGQPLTIINNTGPVLIMFMLTKYQPDYMWLRHVPLKRVYLFSILQIMFYLIMDNKKN
ncbi:hypothetical protein A3Q56_03648 [Intoshia linei]|uniref:Bicarbonate transporter-like transmembrane domain-containing protein n=1 Tax=Intoshia linei TaxID=1819745 RepID=A0A177B4Q8_9BILA|nr:hypothetical protein A3Q56_03648 [Intoshia linei]